MALLGYVAYDPGTAATVSTATAIAMTAMDTTNARITFTAPSSGNVLVRLRTNVHGGAAATPSILLGVLDGSAVKFRACPIGTTVQNAANQITALEAIGLVKGLTASQSYTWDAAYAVQQTVSSSVLEWGGPNTNGGVNAWGALEYEIWDANAMLAGLMYDPGTAAGPVTTSLTAATAFDTTNLRLSVTAGSSGKVLWRCRGAYTGAITTFPTFMIGLMEGAAVSARQFPVWSTERLPANAGAQYGFDASGVLTLSAGAHNLDAAYAIQLVSSAGGLIRYGGPDNNSANNAWGGFLMTFFPA